MKRIFILLIISLLFLTGCFFLPVDEEDNNMSWITPTGHNDPNSAWTRETEAYDDIINYTENYALAWLDSGWTGFLELTHSSIRCSGLRFWAAGGTSIDVDVYYSGAWHHVYEGSYANAFEVQKYFTVNYVTAIRFRFYGTTGAINLYEADFFENPLTAPTVTTQNCTNITGYTATGNGNITNTGGENPHTRGFCYMVGTSGDPTTANSKVYDTGNFGTGAYTKGITGLSPGTSYRVRAYAINSIGTSYGVTVQLTTDTPPTVTTQAVTEILSTTATGNGNITDTGGETPTKRGICWNTTGSPTVANSKSEETGSFGTGAFTRPMTGLSPGVQYFVKAYAYNEAGYAYGGEVNFTTDKVAPTVTTQDATEVSQNHVKGNGNITASGGENATERGFEYGLTQTATWTKKETGSYEAGAFYLTIDGLQANTEYWYRAYAKNTVDPFYGYGEWVQFQTSATGTIPLGTKISICSDYSGNTFKLNSAFTDDGESYQSFFVLSTDLAQKQGLHIYKRLEDLYSYFMKKGSGTAKIYIKRDSEAEWQYCGQISMVGDEDIIVKHLPSENQDISGDVDWLAKHFLIKFVFENDFEFIGLITEAVPIGAR